MSIRLYCTHLMCKLVTCCSGVCVCMCVCDGKMYKQIEFVYIYSFHIYIHIKSNSLNCACACDCVNPLSLLSDFWILFAFLSFTHIVSVATRVTCHYIKSNAKIPIFFFCIFCHQRNFGCRRRRRRKKQ